MKKLLLSFTIFFALQLSASAQVQVNPQIGITLQNLSNPPEGIDYKSTAGFQAGADVRVGGRFYLQPGLFFNRSATIIKYTNADTITIEDNLIRSTLKFKMLGGCKVLDRRMLKLRFMLGPTYDVLMSVDNKDNKIAFNKNDFKGGSLNLDGGIGVDILIFTAEIGYSFGLSNAYKDNRNFLNEKIDSKYLTGYLSLGLVFGKGK
jgi:hypothetical protein